MVTCNYCGFNGDDNDGGDNAGGDGDNDYNDDKRLYLSEYLDTTHYGDDGLMFTVMNVMIVACYF